MPIYSKRAQRDLEEFPESLRAKAEALADRLDAEPLLGQKLKGKLDGLRSVRLGRSHRVIYRIGEQGPEIVTIGMRKDVYR